MDKSKSWFDLNHDWITCDDLIWVRKIWFGNVIWFDFILCDLIWSFEQITTFSNLGQGINFSNSTIPNLCRDIDSQARCTVHWWHFAHRLQSLELLLFCPRDLIWFVICPSLVMRFVFIVRGCEPLFVETSCHHWVTA